MKSISRKISKTRLLFIILSILCMVVIFFFSSENSTESSQTSGRFVKILLGHIFPDFTESSAARQRELIHTTQFIVRKLAHFTIYTTLGLLLSMAMGRRKFLSRQTLLALTAGTVYAVSDELHQSLIPGRSCELRDVMIDTGGVLTGIIISMVLFFIAKKIRKRRNKRTSPDNKKRAHS